ncbi:hypothetical protein [Wolbachia endosymbiont of Chironomus riparius]|uniref:hypothetical protein n=1 Tax=Wolbachia endosymbiont of Chironomus riparius TaxID=2883238 RepID=UPI00209F84A7|nr:hypothetical protein [Wolbachia endosymbiont of Chironomus riparius]
MTDKRNENASRRLTDKEIEETLLGLEKAEKNLSSLKGDEIKEKFSKVFAHSPHPFPEGTSLEDKVKYISEGTKQVQAIREKNLIQKMENISKLSQELESKKKLFKEEGRKNLEKINKRLEENGYVPMNNVEGKSSKELSTKASLREDAHTHTASPISSKENAAQTHLKNNLEPALNYLRDTVDDKNNFLKDNRTLKNGSYKPDEKPKEGNIKKENKNRFSDLINNFCKKVLENLQIDGTSKQKENKNTTLPGNLNKDGINSTSFCGTWTNRWNNYGSYDIC